MQYKYAEPTPRTLQQYCLGGLNGTFKEEGEGEVWKFGPNRSKIRSSSSGVGAAARGRRTRDARPGGQRTKSVNTLLGRSKTSSSFAARRFVAPRLR